MPRVFSVGTVEDDLFDYDLGFGEQQLIPNSQVITSSSQTPRDFPKQTPLNPTTVCSSDVGKLEGCASCSQGKFIKQPSKWKLPSKLPEPLERLQGDICGPIVPPSGPFRYFRVLVDALGRHAEVSLLSTQNS